MDNVNGVDAWKKRVVEWTCWKFHHHGKSGESGHMLGRLCDILQRVQPLSMIMSGDATVNAASVKLIDANTATALPGSAPTLLHVSRGCHLSLPLLGAHDSHAQLRDELPYPSLL
jgi:hypothetical protein